jgi:hypothetical protein
VSLPDLLVFAAALCLIGAAVYAAVHRSWVAALACAAGALLVLAGFVPNL